MSDIKRNKDFWKAYQQYYPLIYSTLVAKLSNKDDAEDICQEVFIRFYKHIYTIEDYRKWLYKAMTFEITNYYNKKSNVKRNDIDIDSIPNDSRLSVKGEFDETRLIVEEAIENMSNFKNEKEKILFDLVAIHNYSYKKAASYLGLTKWQVQYTYNKIEKRLLKYLKEKGIKELKDIL